MIIPGYKIIKDLGQGGMANVYLAEDIKFQTLVAVKVLKKEFLANDHIRKRFIAEARNMFRMSHTNVVKVTDLVENDNVIAFVMEYIKGETLKEYLEKKGVLADVEIKNLLTQMLYALGYIHDQNMVHRDVKPSNFLINEKGQLKLTDFGIAKNNDAFSLEYTITGTTQQLGTPMYMSPEQVKSSKEVTIYSDIYSLGVVLWQMVMGKKPYDGKSLSPFEIQFKIVQESLEITYTDWDKIIQKATSKKEEDRFKSCEDWLNYMDHISEQSEVKKKLFDFANDPGAILMPRLSDTMTDGVIIKWHKKIGDAVKKGDLLAEVETDKATMELESYNDGKLVYVGATEGQKLAVNDLLCVVSQEPSLLNKKKSSPINSEVTISSLNFSNDPGAILMPKLSDTMTEGVIVKWHKKIGDIIKKGDLLAEVETDKATMELESYNDGKLVYIGAFEGQKLAVNDLLCVISKHESSPQVYRFF